MAKLIFLQIHIKFCDLTSHIKSKIASNTTRHKRSYPQPRARLQSFRSSTGGTQNNTAGFGTVLIGGVDSAFLASLCWWRNSEMASPSSCGRELRAPLLHGSHAVATVPCMCIQGRKGCKACPTTPETSKEALTSKRPGHSSKLLGSQYALW